MTSETLLSVRGLKTYFFTSQGIVRAVDGISFDIGRKESVGLVGESGSGKTMTAFSILRLVPSPPGKTVEGEILFKGSDILKLSDEEARSIRGVDISMVFQDPLTYLNPTMKVGDQVAEVFVEHQGLRKARATGEAIKMLEKVRLPEPARFAQSYPFQLSGGMKQRVLIAMALASNPSLLIADEPTTALDVTIQAQILLLLKELIKELGTSLMLITHDLGIVADVCDTVNIMYAGKIVETANVFDFYQEPLHPYTKGLLNSVLSIKAGERKQTLPTIEGVVPDMIRVPAGCRFHPRCPAAMDRCRKEEPTCRTVGDGRRVACWLHQ